MNNETRSRHIPPRSTQSGCTGSRDYARETSYPSRSLGGNLRHPGSRAVPRTYVPIGGVVVYSKYTRWAAFTYQVEYDDVTAEQYDSVKVHALRFLYDGSPELEPHIMERLGIALDMGVDVERYSNAARSVVFVGSETTPLYGVNSIDIRDRWYAYNGVLCKVGYNPTNRLLDVLEYRSLENFDELPGDTDSFEYRDCLLGWSETCFNAQAGETVQLTESSLLSGTVMQILRAYGFYNVLGSYYARNTTKGSYTVTLTYTKGVVNRELQATISGAVGTATESLLVGSHDVGVFATSCLDVLRMAVEKLTGLFVEAMPRVVTPRIEAAVRCIEAAKGIGFKHSPADNILDAGMVAYDLFESTGAPHDTADIEAMRAFA